MKLMYEILPTRDDILEDAAVKCLDMMYRLSTPSITWNKLKKLSLQGDGDRRILWQDHYYLPADLKDGIAQWFIDAYKLDDDERPRFYWELFNSGPTTNADTMREYWKSQGETVAVDEEKYNELIKEL